MMLTQTPGSSSDGGFNYRVLRRPSLSELSKAIKWCDLFWQNNLSLRTVWPAWLLRKPVVITHQGSYCRAASGIDLIQRFKHAIVRRTTSVAISRAIAASFPIDSVVIHNPYDARKCFSGPCDGQHSGRLIFLGRLVSEKGVDILLQALAILQTRNSYLSLTIVGAGPELFALQQLARALRLERQVTFTGPKGGEELTALLRRHEILVVPSRYDEPFGVVALEGIACGCVVVGSRGGGLPEAIGPCGLLFQNGDVKALAAALESLLVSPDERERLLGHAPQHLAKFHPAAIAEEYLALFRSKLS